jgi:hypothetical protein
MSEQLSLEATSVEVASNGGRPTFAQVLRELNAIRTILFTPPIGSRLLLNEDRRLDLAYHLNRIQDMAMEAARPASATDDPQGSSPKPACPNCGGWIMPGMNHNCEREAEQQRKDVERILAAFLAVGGDSADAPLICMVFGEEGNALDSFGYTADELQRRADELRGTFTVGPSPFLLSPAQATLSPPASAPGRRPSAGGAK